MQKINIKVFAVSCGISWALTLFFLGIANMLFGWGAILFNLLSVFYLGYQPTILGSLAGAAWGLGDAALIAIAVGWSFNQYLKGQEQ